MQNPIKSSPLQESPGPSGPGILKQSQKSLPGPSGPGVPKCPKQSQNSLRSLKTVYCETPETVSRLFRTLFGRRGRKGPGDSFETVSGFWARRARETPVRGGRGCNLSVQNPIKKCTRLWDSLCNFNAAARPPPPPREPTIPETLRIANHCGNRKSLPQQKRVRTC